MNLVIVISSTSGCLIFFYNCVKKVCIENKNTCTLYMIFFIRTLYSSNGLGLNTKGCENYLKI